MHRIEGFLNASHREEFILRAIDEKHGLWTGYTRHMRIIEPTTQTWETIGETAILRTIVFE